MLSSLWRTERFLIAWNFFLFIKKKKKKGCRRCAARCYLTASKARQVSMLAVTHAAEELQSVHSLWKPVEVYFQIDFQMMNLLFWRTSSLNLTWSLHYIDSCKQSIFIHSLLKFLRVGFFSCSSRKNTSSVCRKFISFLNPQTSSSDMRWAVSVMLWRCIAALFWSFRCTSE